jgi:hypothetical protein
MSSVDAGTTQTDSLTLERQRGITIKSPLLREQPSVRIAPENGLTMHS